MSVIGSVEPTFGRLGPYRLIDTRAPESTHAIRSPCLAWAGAEVEAGQWWSRVRDPNVRSDSDWTLEYKLGVRVTSCGLRRERGRVI